MEKHIKNIVGASLIEIMVTLVIAALLLMAMVAVFPRMTSHKKAMHEADQAKMIAAEILEGLQMFSAIPGNECLVSGTGVLGIDSLKVRYDPTKTNNVMTVGGVTYWVWGTGAGRPVGASAGVGFSCGGDIKTATVTVSWAKNGKTHNVSVTGAVR